MKLQKIKMPLKITISGILATVLLISVVFSLPTSTTIIGNSGTIAHISPLHVEGKDIKDAFGNVVYLRGVNKVEFADDPDGIWMGDTEWKEANVIAELDAMSSWGVNVIRCHQAIEHWKYDMNQPYAAISHRAAIKRLLTLAAARGMYVIYDGFCVTDYWHGQTQDPLPYPPYQTSQDASSVITSQQDFIDWWVSIASELKGYNNVIFELWNEPYGNSTAKASWFAVAQQTINAIRAAGATQLIVFQWDMAAWVNLNFPTSASDLSWVYEANLTDPLGNIVYSTHLYRSWGHIHYSLPTYINVWNISDIDQSFQLMGYYDVAAKYPLFIGEIGANIAYSGTELDHELEFFNNVLTLLDQHGISYAGFWWRNIGVFALLNGYTTPNQAGQILKTHLLNPI